jgi:hypothetical protein
VIPLGGRRRRRVPRSAAAARSPSLGRWTASLLRRHPLVRPVTCLRRKPARSAWGIVRFLPHPVIIYRQLIRACSNCLILWSWMMCLLYSVYWKFLYCLINRSFLPPVAHLCLGWGSTGTWIDSFQFKAGQMAQIPNLDNAPLNLAALRCPHHREPSDSLASSYIC